jgi:hypothetical protein
MKSIDIDGNTIILLKIVENRMVARRRATWQRRNNEWRQAKIGLQNTKKLTNIGRANDRTTGNRCLSSVSSLTRRRASMLVAVASLVGATTRRRVVGDRSSVLSLLSGLSRRAGDVISGNITLNFTTIYGA